MTKKYEREFARIADAVRAARHVLLMTHENPDEDGLGAMLAFGRWLERQGKVTEAVAKLESVRNYNPNDLGVGFQLAIL